MNCKENKCFRINKIWTILIIAIFMHSNVFSQYVTQIQKITASDSEANEHFGNSISISNNYAIVGALNEGTLSLGKKSSEGAAYMYKKSSTGEWKETQKIVATPRQDDDFFGRSVAIFNNYAFVGAAGHGFDQLDSNYHYSAGAVYVFKRNNKGKWLQHQKLVASDRERNASFGYTITFSIFFLYIYTAPAVLIGAVPNSFFFSQYAPIAN